MKAGAYHIYYSNFLLTTIFLRNICHIVPLSLSLSYIATEILKVVKLENMSDFVTDKSRMLLSHYSRALYKNILLYVNFKHSSQ